MRGSSGDDELSGSLRYQVQTLGSGDSAVSCLGEFKYEVIPSVKKQFKIVKGLLNRPDVDTIYVCTDSGREGEYIYRLVAQMAGVKGKKEKRVWIDSQTEEEIIRGIREAKDLSRHMII